MLKITSASHSSQGGRQYQEDSEAIWPGKSPLLPAGPPSPPPGLACIAVLADGMGGHAAGDVASKTICSVFMERFLGDGNPIVPRLETALHAANEAIRAKVKANSRLGGMGATCVGLAVDDRGGHFISVGDSPLWRLRGSELVRLNDDHSLAPLLDQLVAAGQMDEEDAALDPRRHYLRSAVTGDELELIHKPAEPFDLAPGDIVVLASDGVLTLDDDTIRDVVAAGKNAAPEAIAEALVEAVLGAGDPHQDNTTVVIVKIGG